MRVCMPYGTHANPPDLPPSSSPFSLLLSLFRLVGITEFIANVQREKDEAEKAIKWEAEKQRITGVLDPVTVSLVNYQDSQDLLDKTDAIYDRLDEDESGGLTFEEFKAGLKKLPCAGNIHFTEDDFEIITEYGKLLHSPEKPEFNKMQFRDMMRNELFRFARRNLANALQESEGEEFRQLVLMLKLMETNLSSKIAMTATCSCKAVPEGDLRTMQMLESVVKGQEDLQKQFLELRSRLDNSQSGGTNDQAQIVNKFGYRETRSVDDRLCSSARRSGGIVLAEKRAAESGGIVLAEERAASTTTGSAAPRAVSRTAAPDTAMLRSRVRPDQSKHVEDGPPPLPHLSSWQIAAPKTEDQQYLPKDRELSEEIQTIICETGETGLLEVKKSALLERLKLRREHQSLKRLSAFDDLDNNASPLDRLQRRLPPTDIPRNCPAEMTRTWSDKDKDLLRPADDMAGDSFERLNSRHRSRQDKSNHVQGPPYLPKEQEHLSLLAPQGRPIGGHAVQQLQLHRAKSKSRQSPSNSVQDEQYLPKDKEFWPLPALHNQLKRAQSLKNVSQMTSTLVFKSDPTTLHSFLDDTKATLDAIADAQRLQREVSERQEHMAALEAQRLELSLNHAFTQLDEARWDQESGNDQVFECSCAAQFEHH